MTPVGRLAPSPTGLLHLGHARSFLLAWWHVRSRQGRIVLRLEDLDGPRVQARFIDAALRDLEWLGLDWDGTPYLQSTGLERIEAAIRHLCRGGFAYPCVCTRGDVRSAQSAPQQGVRELRYPGTCRGRFSSRAQAEAATGKPASLRFRVPDSPESVKDTFAGRHTFDIVAEVGDFMISRRDGAPAYQIAVVVDDAHQGVTEVLRGVDLLPSAARQQQLQRALGFATPAWVHVPLVLDETGRRLAKRHDDLSLSELRERDVDPRAVVAWAARSAGFDVPARVTASDLLPDFDLSRVAPDTVRVTPDDIRALLP